ncbi:MAG: hypothetical protein IPN93_00005 [Bacteroidetes bacterium]|nr:hypothetical protein [Bacteroidota bacterium]
MESIKSISKRKKEGAVGFIGIAGADVKWLRNFQSIVSRKYNEYNPTELIDWNERQNDELQEKGRKCGVEIEKHMKKSILSKLQEIFNDKWDLEIGSIPFCHNFLSKICQTKSTNSIFKTKT